MLSKAREKLKSDIENITDEATIEKVKDIYNGHFGAESNST